MVEHCILYGIILISSFLFFFVNRNWRCVAGMLGRSGTSLPKLPAGCTTYCVKCYSQPTWKSEVKNCDLPTGTALKTSSAPAMQQMLGCCPAPAGSQHCWRQTWDAARNQRRGLHRAARVPEMPSLGMPPSSTSFLPASSCGLKWSCFPVSLGSLWLDSEFHEGKSVCTNPGIISNTHLSKHSLTHCRKSETTCWMNTRN